VLVGQLGQGISTARGVLDHLGSCQVVYCGLNAGGIHSKPRSARRRRPLGIGVPCPHSIYSRTKDTRG
jgi:hypothetical protein